MKKRLFLPFLLCLLLAASGCAAKKKDPNAVNNIPVEKLYNSAAFKLDKGEYADAAKGFDEVDRAYPYSQWATRAQLMAGYAQYKNLKYDEAILALDHFIELHPGDENAPYAYYLKGLCYYEQISDVGRDQKMTEQALDTLQQVVQRFPDSFGRSGSVSPWALVAISFETFASMRE